MERVSMPSDEPSDQSSGMRLVIERVAARRMLAMPKELHESLRRRLDAIAADPFNRDLNDGPYKAGGKDCFKVRQGDWRAIYAIDRKAREVRVQVVDTRGRVYR
jgi:mRNA-degrading endonuclease RelE of RelBE toxin-antitoxin system